MESAPGDFPARNKRLRADGDGLYPSAGGMDWQAVGSGWGGGEVVASSNAQGGGLQGGFGSQPIGAQVYDTGFAPDPLSGVPYGAQGVPFAAAQGTGTAPASSWNFQQAAPTQLAQPGGRRYQPGVQQPAATGSHHFSQVVGNAQVWATSQPQQGQFFSYQAVAPQAAVQIPVQQQAFQQPLYQQQAGNRDQAAMQFVPQQLQLQQQEAHFQLALPAQEVPLPPTQQHYEPGRPPQRQGYFSNPQPLPQQQQQQGQYSYQYQQAQLPQLNIAQETQQQCQPATQQAWQGPSQIQAPHQPLQGVPVFLASPAALPVKQQQPQPQQQQQQAGHAAPLQQAWRADLQAYASNPPQPTSVPQRNPQPHQPATQHLQASSHQHGIKQQQQQPAAVAVPSAAAQPQPKQEPPEPAVVGPADQQPLRSQASLQRPTQQAPAPAASAQQGLQETAPVAQERPQGQVQPPAPEVAAPDQDRPPLGRPESAAAAALARVAAPVDNPLQPSGHAPAASDPAPASAAAPVEPPGAPKERPAVAVPAAQGWTAEEEAELLKAVEAEKENLEDAPPVQERPSAFQQQAETITLPAAEMADPGAESAEETRILAVVYGVSEGASLGGAPGPLGDFVASPSEPGGTVKILWGPSPDVLSEFARTFRPRLVYVLAVEAPGEDDAAADGAGQDPPPELADFSPWDNANNVDDMHKMAWIMQAASVKSIYFDAHIEKREAEELRAFGVQEVISWVQSDDYADGPDWSAASSFGRTFFRLLRSTEGVPVPEAFALTVAAAETRYPAAACPVMPSLVSNFDPLLPDHNNARSLRTGDTAALKKAITSPEIGWRRMRLVAPRAQLRLILSRGPSGACEPRRSLGKLVEALRSFLVLDVRQVLLEGWRRVEPGLRPRYLSDAECIACEVLSGCGAAFRVLLGGPAQALARPRVVRLALAQSLATDAMHLYVQIGASSAATATFSSPAGGPAVTVPATEVVATTSLWACDVLRQCASGRLPHAARALLSLGVLQVDDLPVPMCTADAELLSSLPVPESQSAAAIASDHQAEPEMLVGGARPFFRQQGATPPLDYGSVRLPLHLCSREQLLADIHLFHKATRGVPLSIPRLDGEPADICTLYVEICKRGGQRFSHAINWLGQVYPRLRNFREGHKSTSISHRLKTIYMTCLSAYEQNHPEDVAKDQCGLCGSAEAGNWVECSKCSDWFHYECDTRQGLPLYSEYEKNEGLEYTCLQCSS